MSYDEQSLLEFLKKNNIEYQYVSHPAVYTVAESDEHGPTLPGAGTKNLFLRDNKGRRYYLVVVQKDKLVDLKRLGELIGSGRPSFGSAEKLQTMLGVLPGAVTVAAVLNDPEHQVALFIDEDVWNAEAMTCHPLANTATIQLKQEGLRELVKLAGKEPGVIEIPLQEGS